MLSEELKKKYFQLQEFQRGRLQLSSAARIQLACEILSLLPAKKRLKKRTLKFQKEQESVFGNRVTQLKDSLVAKNGTFCLFVFL